ncbi:unnamed protein product [Lactuca virosa]|uniref:Uncharacterized protein n=1 Tax=Lactuca virosa TaxID=75947 RepID=A0AAU9NAA9_9ASTR|nr:unnamed protein product [Lactuca virosa]
MNLVPVDQRIDAAEEGWEGVKSALTDLQQLMNNQCSLLVEKMTEMATENERVCSIFSEKRGKGNSYRLPPPPPPPKVVTKKRETVLKEGGTNRRFHKLEMLLFNGTNAEEWICNVEKADTHSLSSSNRYLLHPRPAVMPLPPHAAPNNQGRRRTFAAVEDEGSPPIGYPVARVGDHRPWVVWWFVGGLRAPSFLQPIVSAPRKCSPSPSPPERRRMVLLLLLIHGTPPPP